jgi:hypothetical protein
VHVCMHVHDHHVLACAEGPGPAQSLPKAFTHARARLEQARYWATCFARIVHDWMVSQEQVSLKVVTGVAWVGIQGHGLCRLQ